MVFGKRKIKKETKTETQPEVVEVDDDEFADRIYNPNMQQNIQQNTQQPEQQSRNIPGFNSIQQPMAAIPNLPATNSNVAVQQQTEPKITNGGVCRILAGEIVEHNGKNFYKYIIMTNKQLGDIGDEFPLD